MTNNLLPVSFEFFPPQTEEGQKKFLLTVDKLGQHSPEFMSITFGAGGSTQHKTLDAVISLQNKQINVVPHISCISASKQQILALLKRYQSLGLHRLVCLRGDLPSGMAIPGELHYANELVSFIREQTGDHFHIDVAAYPETHPQSPHAQADLENFRRKVDAGANGAITQFFYNADAYEDFLNRAQTKGVNIPIVPGIMPILSSYRLTRFADTCGAEIPKWVRQKLIGYGDDKASIQAFGVELVTKLCERLLAIGTPSLHFYTLNSETLTNQILTNITTKSAAGNKIK